MRFQKLGWIELRVAIQGKRFRNSQAVNPKRNLQVTDDHFDKATRFPTRAAAEIEKKSVKPDETTVIRPARENEQAPVFPGLSREFTSSTITSDFAKKSGLPPQGLEP